jgi:hypothetical protein
LAVVASVQNVDALSTVALALAVLAFAAQLIVSLAQANSGAQQIAQSERIYAETQSALTELRAASHSQLSNQKEIVAHLLQAALPSVAQEISDDVEVSSDLGSPTLDAEVIEERLSVAIDNVLANLPSALAGKTTPPLVPKSRADSRKRGGNFELERELSSIDKGWAKVTFARLSSDSARLFYNLCTLFASTRNSDAKLGVNISTTFPERAYKELQELRLVQIQERSDIKADSNGKPSSMIFELTIRGSRLANYLLGFDRSTVISSIKRKEDLETARPQEGADD